MTPKQIVGRMTFAERILVESFANKNSLKKLKGFHIAQAFEFLMRIQEACTPDSQTKSVARTLFKAGYERIRDEVHEKTRERYQQRFFPDGIPEPYARYYAWCCEPSDISIAS